MAILLVIGLYFPTSFGGTISKSLYAVQFFIATLLIIYYLISSQNYVNSNFYIAMGIHITLWMFTIVSHLYSNVSNINFGGYLPYIVISFLFLLDIKKLIPSNLTKNVFLGLGLINIILGICLIFDVEIVKTFFLNFYAFGNEEVLPDLLAKNKPILFFGSHSIASFYYYLFFYISLKSFQCCKKNIYLAIGLCYAILIVFLFSVSSYVFLLLVIINLCLNFKSVKYFVLILLLLIIFYYFQTISQIFNDFIKPVFLSGGAGFLGRYSSEGVLVETVGYIKDHPFLPTGLCVSNSLYTTDSGLVLNMLLGSVILIALVYGSFLIFLVRNLKYKSSIAWIFFVYMIFEIGYPNLFYARTWYLLPFIVIFLNSSEPEIPAKDQKMLTLN